MLSSVIWDEVFVLHPDPLCNPILWKIGCLWDKIWKQLLRVHQLPKDAA